MEILDVKIYENNNYKKRKSKTSTNFDYKKIQVYTQICHP